MMFLQNGFSEALRKNDKLKHLDLSNSQLPMEAFVGIGSGLKNNRTLKTLDLSERPEKTNLYQYHGIGKRFKEFERSIRGNKTIEVLNLRNVGLDVMGAYYLGKLIMNNQN